MKVKTRFTVASATTNWMVEPMMTFCLASTAMTNSSVEMVMTCSGVMTKLATEINYLPISRATLD